MSPDRKTHWNLPLIVSLELTAEQQDRIRDLIYDFERKTRRTARAKMSASQPVNLPLEEPDIDSVCIAPAPMRSDPVSARAADARVESFYIPMCGLHLKRK